MHNISSNWQDSLNQKLVNRLNRPLHQPGMIKMAMSQRMINRCDRLLNRLPLLSQQMQRWGNTNTTTPDAVPIVYAQPLSLTNERGTESREQNFQPNFSQNQPSVPLIQRKIDSSQPLVIKPDNSTVDTKNNNYLSNDNFIKNNIKADFTSEIPVVLSQPISDKLLETEEIPLQGKFTDSKIFLSNPSQLNLNISSTSTKDEITEINKNAISSSLQPISEQITLVQKPISADIQQLPIVQRKQQTASLSPSSLPVVYPLNSLTSAKQIQPINSSEQINSIKQENLASRISSPNFNIVTAHPLTDKVNSREEQISFNTNSSHSQNQYFNTSNSQTNQTTPFPVEDYRSRSVSLQGENKNAPDAENTEERGSEKCGLGGLPHEQLFKTKERLVILERDWSNYNQNISDLPIVTVASPINYTSKPQSLPLAISTSLSNSIRHDQPNISKVSKTNFSSSSKVFASPSSPTETDVYSITNQSHSKIDINTIANQVERKLMRRLVIESERRGKIR
ncbi:MAG: hypothetical protein HC907_02765 [Richelia sp. SM1_7_0]|nr:hypothetical protein [Richelia sp. SM1_7_0]